MSETYELKKLCEVCEKPIPDDFLTPLCWDCYDKVAEENERIKTESSPTPQEIENVSNTSTTDPLLGIKDPIYQANPQREDKEQWIANIAQFQHSGKLLWYHTRDMYSWIKDYCILKVKDHPQYPKFIWKPKIVDVGCGCGIGSNVLSQEADFVWGIDKNLNSIKFAQEAFTRVKNNVYYNSQVTFDQIDIMEDTREFLKFDLVVAIEIIEHIADHRKFLETIIRKFDKRNVNEPTEYFISTPNRNRQSLNQDHPKNPFHVKEFRAEEFVEELSHYFNKVELFNVKGKPEPIDTTQSPILAKVSQPKI